jgi:hypothetical protein
MNLMNPMHLIHLMHLMLQMQHLHFRSLSLLSLLSNGTELAHPKVPGPRATCTLKRAAKFGQCSLEFFKRQPKPG